LLIYENMPECPARDGGAFFKVFGLYNQTYLCMIYAPKTVRSGGLPGDGISKRQGEGRALPDPGGFILAPVFILALQGVCINPSRSILGTGRSQNRSTWQ